MKLSEVKTILLEAPYVHAGEYVPSCRSDGFMSSSAIKRDYLPFGMFEAVGDTIIELHILDAPLPKIIGTVIDEDPLGDDSNRIVFSLKFKSRPTFNDNLISGKVLQVDSVFGEKDTRSEGLGSFVYALLVKKRIHFSF